MTTDNAKPAVITAAEFVAGGYAERIAAGECVVRCPRGWGVESVVLDEPVGMVSAFYHDGDYNWYETGKLFVVEWLPATPATEAEVTRLRAENARLREKATRWRNALEVIVNNADTYQSSVKEPVSDYYRGVIDGRNATVHIARAALDATGEAQS